MAMLATACAPSTISPMVIRMNPRPDGKTSTMVGVRTGPRLSAPLSTVASAPFTGFEGDRAPFAMPQMGLAYDLGVTWPVSADDAIHLGGSGELYYPFPLPAYGVYGGYSHFFRSGAAGIAPAVVFRGATDLGTSIGGPGTIVGAELSTSLSYEPEERISLALVPFVGMHRLFSGPTTEVVTYTGGAMAVRIQDATTLIEITGGFGRVFAGNRESWTAPILGVRAGR
jgi:hypothetical protein